MIENEDSLSKVIEFIGASNSNTVVVSHLIHRDVGGCQEVCGGCCKKVTLDYLESSNRWQQFKELHSDKVSDFKPYTIEGHTFLSNSQESNSTGFCQYLNMENGLCTIHNARPLMCQSTPLKFKMNPSRDRVLLTSETYGRKHAFKRVDGQRGAKCKMLPTSEKRKEGDIQFLEELREIGIIFKLKTTNLEKLIEHLKVRELNSKSTTFNF